MNRSAHLALVVLLTAASTAAARRPNIVFLLVDDLGWGAMSAYGSTMHDTPHFDRLCERGMRFTNAYAACTVCSPSRAALLTGRYPARLRLTDWIPGHAHPNAPLAIPDWDRQINPQLDTLPETLRGAGYQTWFLGKWHLQPIDKRWSRERTKREQALHTPQAHGFDVNIGGREWGQPKGRGKYFYPFDMPGIESGEEGEYLTDRLTDEALGLLDQAGDEPFLLYLSYYTVHGPLMGKPEYVSHYRDAIERSGDHAQAAARANYAAMHRSLDDSVGRITAKLDELGLADDTIIVFTGDNGGDRHDACGGLRGRKGTAFEGGVREPTCVVWPGRVPAGASSDTPIIGMDFYPTLLALAGVAPQPQQHLDGVDLSPVLTGSGGIEERNLFWHYPHYHRTTPYSSVRSGDWKLIEWHEDDQLMLFDLSADPAEKTNLAGAKPDKAVELKRALDEWREAVAAQPTTRKAG
ncbi:Arylsulfatase [Posidoniimonas corsicana]|uniref:Arylsulfatase n=1 Tax=Posidoniimonas corsicana TaxID=1938618 RepID=A0A5C5VG50_9BACT|nr:sulfatase [Posidoniimonas corsicana]TWT36879.1 Arylsulfatase [Posidoniimonas corsicana]